MKDSKKKPELIEGDFWVSDGRTLLQNADLYYENGNSVIYRRKGAELFTSYSDVKVFNTKEEAQGYAEERKKKVEKIEDNFKKYLKSLSKCKYTNEIAKLIKDTISGYGYLGELLIDDDTKAKIDLYDVLMSGTIELRERCDDDNSPTPVIPVRNIESIKYYTQMNKDYVEVRTMSGQVYKVSETSQENKYWLLYYMKDVFQNIR